MLSNAPRAIFILSAENAPLLDGALNSRARSPGWSERIQDESATFSEMAQWLGQFTGSTHATRLADAEDALRHAVDALGGAASDGERAQKMHAVHVGAERVVALRLRMLKARIIALAATDRVDVGWRSSETERAPAKPRRAPAESISSLRAREEHVRAVNVEGVLREFGVESTKTQSSQ